jgi:hypothetical protein
MPTIGSVAVSAPQPRPGYVGTPDERPTAARPDPW